MVLTKYIFPITYAAVSGVLFCTLFSAEKV